MVGYKIRIENVVASATLNVKVKLEKIVSNFENVEYEPEQFPGVVYRVVDPKAAALIFSSGKIVCTGAKSPKDSKIVVAKIVVKMRKLGIMVPDNYTVRLENIVASANLGRELNLDKIAFTMENTEYEPEQFPGLVFRMDQPKVTFLLFGSGKVICTGGRTIKDVERAVDKVSKRLKRLDRELAKADREEQEAKGIVYVKPVKKPAVKKLVKPVKKLAKKPAKKLAKKSVKKPVKKSVKK
jgi:transcription initiation factor TFIID TATA-box-binding protein